jgi:hypothetical protein
MQDKSEYQLRAKYYDILPSALLVLNADDQIVFENKKFSQLMQIAKQEFGSLEKAKDLFVQACQINGNKLSWLMRIMDLPRSSVIPLKVRALSPPSESERIFFIDILEEPRDSQKLGQWIYGSLRIDTLANTAIFHRQLVPLSGQEFSLLAYLAQNEDRLLSKRDIKKAIWHNRQVNPRAVDILVGRLKHKLEAVGMDSAVIQTMHGRGYIFRTELLF